MQVGFETVGNATIICYDYYRPVLSTDPWIKGYPYFGSWALSHEIPAEQMEAILACEYIWISHGHPDHLISDSLSLLKGKKILIPDHYGARILHDLKQQDYDVHVLSNKVWTRLSDNIWVICLSDYNQDATLLIDINGRLIVNMNDSSALGWAPFIRKTIREYDTSYYLRLYGGHADMENFFDESGNRLPPSPPGDWPWGATICRDTDHFGAKYFVPFSSFHKMNRTDSLWLEAHKTPLSGYSAGYESKISSVTSPFISCDCRTDTWTELNPDPSHEPVQSPAEFGDDWTEPLSAADFQDVTKYFTSIEHLSSYLDFVTFRVGREDHTIDLRKRDFKRGITFEVPRNSLVSAISWEIFDDLLIGNFMKVTLNGTWRDTLYPNFSPYVAKYADNGRARTKDELRDYFRHYRQQIGVSGVVNLLQQGIEEKSKNVFRAFIRENSPIYKTSKALYYTVRSGR